MTTSSSSRTSLPRPSERTRDHNVIRYVPKGSDTRLNRATESSSDSNDEKRTIRRKISKDMFNKRLERRMSSAPQRPPERRRSSSPPTSPPKMKKYLFGKADVLIRKVAFMKDNSSEHDPSENIPRLCDQDNHNSSDSPSTPRCISRWENIGSPNPQEGSIEIYDEEGNNDLGSLASGHVTRLSSMTDIHLPEAHMYPISSREENASFLNRQSSTLLPQERLVYISLKMNFRVQFEIYTNSSDENLKRYCLLYTAAEISNGNENIYKILRDLEFPINKLPLEKFINKDNPNWRLLFESNSDDPILQSYML